MTIRERFVESLALCGVLVAGAAWAADPEEVIKYRQAAMKALGGHTSAMAQIVRGKVPFGGQLDGHAQAAASLTKDIPAMFPAGSDFGESDAKPDVWKNRAEFEKVAGDSGKAAGLLAAAARSGDPAAAGRAFDGFAQTCKGCHQGFRAK